MPADKISKRQWLRQHGTLNPRPQDVAHELFRQMDFFDPQDLIQVKYEMLRQVRVEEKPIQQAGELVPTSPPPETGIDPETLQRRGLQR